MPAWKMPVFMGIVQCKSTPSRAVRDSRAVPLVQPCSVLFAIVLLRGSIATLPWLIRLDDGWRKLNVIR
ncbi:hypothetical protein JYU34_015494 [Plutella xylostella]|uniref:Uncharacterized protein n=1 Tax=Plutella xylostella TaxID=51655 RepID=A0ABQ7Q781_PLUXY|nr:hypothetical protein JYU34_015494 [Plutella xylostella]